jgi:adenylate cyclase
MSLFSELKRRNVFRVALAYLMLSWLILQIVGEVSDILVFPGWVAQAFLLLLAVMLPIALIITWAFELTPEGLKKTDEIEEGQSTCLATGQKINYMIIAFLVLVIGFQFWMNSEGPLEVRANSIAVMPFADMSADGSQEYFGDGMAEEILNVLVSVDELDVTSRTTAFSLKDENLSIPEIAARLNVNYILEGSIRSDGDNVRVTAQLIDVAADTHLWLDTFDRELTSIFAIQDEISVAIADALKVELIGDVIGDVPTQNMEAYALALQARRILDLPNYENALAAMEVIEQALLLDPDYAEGWSFLGLTHITTIFYGAVNYSDEELNKILDVAYDAVNKAISLDPGLGTAWSRKGIIHRINLQWMEAMTSSLQGVYLNDQDDNNWRVLAAHYQSVGAIDQAKVAYQNAIDNNPAHVGSVRGSGLSLLIEGNIDQAKLIFEKADSMLIGSATFNQAVLNLMDNDREGALEDFNSYLKFMGLPAQENLKYFIEAYYDPSLREDYKKLLPDPSIRTVDINRVGSLLLLDGEYYVEMMKINYTGIFASIFALYMPPFRPMLNQSSVKDYLTEIGLVDHWRKTSFPKFCQPIGNDDYECE